MEFSSIWFFSIWSLISLTFLTTGIYCLDKARIATFPGDLFIHQIQAWIASSVILSVSYAFLFRPPLEFDADGTARKLIIFYGFFHPELIRSLLFPFFSLYNYLRFGNDVNLILPLISLIPIVLFFYQAFKYFKKNYGNENGDLLGRIANTMLLYPYHCLSWISFIVFMFFCLCANFENKYTPIFPTGDCLSIWGLYLYVSLVLQTISILGCTVFLKNFLVPKSSFLNYVYEKRKLFEIVLGLIFVSLAQYLSREKSLHLMFAFLSFAITWLGNIANVQPTTDLGIFHFFVSSSMECAVSRFGFHFYTFLVLCGCIALEILRWKIESVSLRHTGMSKSAFLDWVSLGQANSSSPLSLSVVSS